MVRRLFPAVVAASLIVACGSEENNSNNTNNGSNNGTSAMSNNGTVATNNGSASNNGTTGTNAATGGSNNTTGTVEVCDTPDCECFSNDNCPANMRCEDTGNGVETPRCVEGARGTGVTGDMCQSEGDCASGVCIGRNNDPYVCSEECDMNDLICPNNLECVWVPGSGGGEYWCVTPRL